MKKGVNIVITNNQGEIFVLKRSQKEKSFPGFWDLPGGKIKNTETLQEAAKRETEEESGLNVKLEQGYFYIFHCQDKGFNEEFNIYSFRANLISGEVILSEEHTEFRWISKDEWQNLGCTPSVTATIKEFFK